jgi:aspartate aminotransferase-like enzyme
VLSGRHFLQIPGPTNVPERVLEAISRSTIDHRGPEFIELATEVLQGLQGIFGCSGPVFIFPSSGTGAWEAALVNALCAGDRVLMSRSVSLYATNLFFGLRDALAIFRETGFESILARHARHAAAARAGSSASSN